jgi:hypothetical protein
MEAIRPVIRAFWDTAAAVLTVAGGLVLLVGIPLGWLWMASQIYGKTGAVSGGVAAFIFFGIVVSYGLVLLIASWVRARFAEEPGDSKRAAWNRSMRDTTRKPGERKADPVERLLVATAILAFLGLIIWFAFFSGSPI